MKVDHGTNESIVSVTLAISDLEDQDTASIIVLSSPLRHSNQIQNQRMS